MDWRRGLKVSSLVQPARVESASRQGETGRQTYNNRRTSRIGLQALGPAPLRPPRVFLGQQDLTLASQMPTRLSLPPL